MITPSSIALTGFITWALFLLVLMEVLRALLVLRDKMPASSFSPDNAGLSPFMQRLAGAHANCVESLPLFGGLLLVAIVTDRTAVTDPLAWLLLGSRIFQSVVHVTSVSPVAVTIRFAAFTVQMAIALYWAFQLLLSA